MLQKNLPELRRKKGLSQESFAELFGVTRQSVQKWESGDTQPTIDRLLEIADYFRISVDALLGRQKTDVETLRTSDVPVPKYDTLDTFDDYSAQLANEEYQCRDEGRDTSSIRELVPAIERLPNNRFRAELADTFYRMTLSLPPVPDYRYTEPSSYEAIEALCTHSPGTLKSDRFSLHDRLSGAVIGRICGCLLGKPLEEMKLRELVPFLRQTGNYPMHRYVLSSDLTDRVCAMFTYPLAERKPYCADTVTCAPADDDTNYTVLASEILRKYGRDFKPAHVAREWLTRQSKFAYCTAERVAYRNFVNGYVPPSSAEYKNPYREWIGAQIRADFYGYINPGDPKAAAEMAFRDACVSHTKNGIYGAMFVAAMIAAAAAVSSPEKVIEYGLAEIPSTSRLYAGVKHILSLFCSGASREETVADIHSRWNDELPYHWCHVIPNAEIVTAALLYGKRDLAQTVCTAVQCGFDTDCNGATAGSVAGMICGAGRIPPEWKEPVGGVLTTDIFGIGSITVQEIVRRAESLIP